MSAKAQPLGPGCLVALRFYKKREVTIPVTQGRERTESSPGNLGGREEEGKGRRAECWALHRGTPSQNSSSLKLQEKLHHN